MAPVEVDFRHPLRPAVERHIVSVYRRAFGAEVTLFAPRLIAEFDSAGRVRCATGIRTAGERFHSECYLDRPAEEAATSALGRRVARGELLEFTTLACTRTGEALEFVSDVVRQGREKGCRIALFTGTAPLRNMLTRTGIVIIPIAAADRGRVNDPDSWGRYYDTDPRVCIAPDSHSVPRVLRTPYFGLPRIRPLRFARTTSGFLSHA